MKKESNNYTCEICNIIYSREELASACELSHEIVYVPFNREDLFKLIQFIMTKDESLIKESLIKTLRNYYRGEYK